MSQDDDKRIAAIAAAGEVQDGMLVGLGSGSTAAFMIAELGRRQAEGLRFDAVATSFRSERLAEAAGIRIMPFDTVARVDLAIDGTDEIDPALRAIKGAGGAMLREKCVAAAATRMVVIADAAKRVDRLGKAAVPCETLPFAQAYVARALTELGAAISVRLRPDGAIFLTDQQNVIIDCRFGAIDDPAGLAAQLSAIAGLLGHGLFVDEVDALYVADGGALSHVERPRAV